MASPTKKARLGDDNDETVVGYLHGVSPVKVSRKNNRYFEASLQTGQQEFRRLVCFSPDKRAVCMQASENHQPVKLVDCRKAISNMDAGSYEVLLSGKSRVEATDNVAFGYRQPCLITKKTIAEIMSMGPRQKVASIDVKLIQAIESQMVVLNEEAMEVKKFVICDPTGQSCISVWGDKITALEEGKSYQFQNVTTRKNADVTVLTTTPSTEIKNIPEVAKPSCLKPLSANVEQTVQGEVIGVQILSKSRCRRCHGNQNSIGRKSTSHRCDKCKILQLISSYAYMYSGVLIIKQDDGTEYTGSITNSAMFKFIQDNLLNSSSHDGSLLEEYVIGLGQVKVITNGEGLVLRFSPVQPKETGPQVDTEEGVEEEMALRELFDIAE